MSAPLRPLLPAIPGVQRRQPPVPIGDQQQKRRRVSNACEACRLQKSRCSGEQPTCTACTKRNTHCRYPQTEARQVRQRYEDLQKRRSAHEELLGLMSTLPEQDATELFLRVQAGGDITTIVKHVQDGNLLLQLQLVPETRLRYELPHSRDMPALLLTSESPYLNSLIYEAASQRALHVTVQGHERGRVQLGQNDCLQGEEEIPKENSDLSYLHNIHNVKLFIKSAATEPNHCVFPAEYASSEYRSEYVKPYHAAVFVEPRLENVKPSEWTTVSKDDTLMRDLLAAYFTHEYHLWPLFQKDYFLEDMAKPKTDDRQTPCCSSLLVIAILAYACYCSKKIPNRFRYWEPEGLGYRFLAEAKRIWEMQIISRKYRHLTSVQAALIINIVHHLYGLDKIGDTYGRKGWVIAQEMQLFDGNAHILSERVRNARNFTAWCLFGIDSHLAWQFFRRPFLAKPPMFALPDPSVNAAWYGEIWLRYPLSETLSPTNYGHVFKALSDFRIILGELCYASFGTDSKIPEEQAMAFVSRLLAWYKKLPIPLMPKNIVLPVHLLMHLDYQIVLMIVCQPFINDDWVGELIPKNIVSHAERDINVPSQDELSKLAKRFLKLDSGEQSDSEAGNSSPLPL
ncbi:hypothetical protein DM02DRAFT_662521 [Periconia macrospinosa]|uniref:Zn(2)-C6 fungal-type domain-containing protein n=1 Tax=Periconia macrospinosa TaxID=97972 RepID=A0A2V1D6V4_9PLEO|nr:hypothetical protein DM02DRAFT_662521 [Periconia macrospinosa]